MQNIISNQLILKKLSQIKNKYLNIGIEILGIFGSFARDEATKNSDIDILYTTKKGVKDLYDKKQKLKQELKNIFNLNIDLASAKYLKPYAKDIIMKDLLYVK
jgi:predicted nucleotidyltransferase